MIHQGCGTGFVFPIIQRDPKPSTTEEPARGYCALCGKPLPKRRRRFCSDKCMLAHKRTLNRGYMRESQGYSSHRAYP